jgi:hypothetical protein
MAETPTEISLADLQALGFTLAGEANVQANVEVDEVSEADAEAAEELRVSLVAAAELLYEHAQKRPQTKGSKPRFKRTIGDAAGIQPYRVIVTMAKS